MRQTRLHTDNRPVESPGESEVARTPDASSVLEVHDLYVSFRHALGRIRAVNGVSFKLSAGSTLGIVGESGCGKSVTALSILRLLPSPPGNIDCGSILLTCKDGVVDLASLPPRSRKLRKIRGKEVSMIFQEPMRSLHPMFPVDQQIIEGIIEHTKATKAAALEEARDLLQRVGVSDPDTVMNQYPHQLSGGIRQRVMIAIALACRPRLLIADEPTTALDVTIQAQILELLERLRRTLRMSIVLISHDLGVIAEMADEVLVMYLGKAVEHGSAEDIFGSPAHPYTKKLLQSVPSLSSIPKTALAFLPGVVPELLETPEACVFANRCEQTLAQCENHAPPRIKIAPTHTTECWRYAAEHADG